MIRIVLAIIAVSAAASQAVAFPLREAGRERPTGSVPDGSSAQEGFLSLGAFLRNPRGTVAARPDGSGTSLTRAQLYIADALNGDRGRTLADLQFLSDRDARSSFKPVSMDYYLGFATRKDDWRLQTGRGEGLALDDPPGGGGGYRYWDLRLAYLLGSQSAAGGGKFGGPAPGAMSMTLSGSWLFHNTTLPARGDGAGIAYFRYGAMAEGSVLGGALLLRADAEFQTERRRKRPVDLDLDLGLGLRLRSLELVLSRRSRESLDRSGSALAYRLDLRYPFAAQR